MLKSLTLTALAGLSFHVFASTPLTYDCGQEFRFPVSLVVKPTPGGAYGFEGTFTAPGKDLVTGQFITSKTTPLVGSMETIDGKQLYRFHAPVYPPYQVIAVVASPGEYAAVEEVTMTGDPIADGKTRYCLVR